MLTSIDTSVLQTKPPFVTFTQATAAAGNDRGHAHAALRIDTLQFLAEPARVGPVFIRDTQGTSETR